MDSRTAGVLNGIRSLGYPMHAGDFRKAPRGAYIVYRDEQERGGADLKNTVTLHRLTIEFYSEEVKKDVEKRIEELLDNTAIKYIKLPVEWLEDVQRYQVLYDLKYLDKE